MSQESKSQNQAKPVLLVIDDEPSILRAFGWVIRKLDVGLLTADTAAQGIEMVQRHRPDVIVLDINLPDLSGLEVFRKIHKLEARIPVIFITGHGTTDTAIEAIKLGALDYLHKPLDLDKIREVLTNAFEVSRTMRVPARMATEESVDARSDVLIGRCEAMLEVYQMIGRVAQQEMPVLILGESGTGKELVARAIWNHSHRSTSPLLAINCAAIPETLLESELFGHEKGAFTGADQLRIGKFEQCSGGTLFLDEIGDMAPAAQAKILRVLQDQKFERVGGNQTIETDVRLIAATNRRLEELLPNSQFRSDLYYRLSVFSIRLPPLRDRDDDLKLLVDHFLKKFSRELGKEVRGLTPKAMEMLGHFPWPGNVRELQSVLKQAILQTPGPLIAPDALPTTITGLGKGIHSVDSVFDESNLTDWDQFIIEKLRSGSDDLYAKSMAPIERHLLTRVLKYTGGNQLQSAKILGISRGTLRSKIQALGIALD